MIIKKIKIKKLIIIGLIGPHNYYEESYNIILGGHKCYLILPKYELPRRKHYIQETNEVYGCITSCCCGN